MDEERYDHADKFGYPEEWGMVEYRDKDGKPMSSRQFMESLGLEVPADLGTGPPDARPED